MAEQDLKKMYRTRTEGDFPETIEIMGRAYEKNEDLRYGTNPRSDSLDKLRFSAAQWTFHGEDFAALERVPYLAAQINGLCG